MSDDIPNRRSIRLPGYDYSQKGYYFVTICTQNHSEMFGKIVNGKMVLNDVGEMINKKINELKIYENINVDIQCVMPNHVHLILIIVGAGPCARPKQIKNDIIGSKKIIIIGSTQGSTPTLGEYIKRFKTLTTRIYIQNVKSNHWPKFHMRLWQRNYYEHIIRSEREYKQIVYYIRSNPQNWGTDKNNIYA